MKLKNRSRPLFGVSIFLQVKKNKANKEVNVLVPFSGFLSFYKALDALLFPTKGSRPLFGVSIFLRTQLNYKEFTEEFSSPFRGFYLSTIPERPPRDGLPVLVPFSGFLSFYIFSRHISLNRLPEVLVPFSGFLSFYPSLYIPCYFCIYNLFCGLKIKYLENHIAIFTKYLLKPHNYLIG